MGCIVMYGAYLPKNESIVKTSFDFIKPFLKSILPRLQNVSKASFYSLVLLFIFYSYGYLYDLLNEITFISELSRHRFLIPLIFTLLILMIFQLV